MFEFVGFALADLIKYRKNDTPGYVCRKKGVHMPTINQLVRKKRKDKTRKSKSPVLGIRLNTL